LKLYQNRYEEWSWTQKFQKLTSCEEMPWKMRKYCGQKALNQVKKRYRKQHLFTHFPCWALTLRNKLK
jgi:hypothetical protein